MEDEISASVARGYCVDAETGALVVGAGAIVEKVMVKYRGDSEAPGRISLRLFSPRKQAACRDPPRSRRGECCRGPGPGVSIGGARGEQRSVRDARDVERRVCARRKRSRCASNASGTAERAAACSELQQSRAETQMARLEARSEHSIAEAVETMSLEYEKEEDVSVRRLELAAEVRARALRLYNRRRKSRSKAALRAVLAELGELKARLARVRDAQETSARLIAPTVASALACLKL